MLQTPQVKASLLVKLIPHIPSVTGSEVRSAYKDSIAIHIIDIYGLKMAS